MEVVFTSNMQQLLCKCSTVINEQKYRYSQVPIGSAGMLDYF